MNNELSLLAEAISTNGDVENNEIRYMYVDDSTILRFENNKMKKVSAAMIKKARKLLETQENSTNDAKQTKKKTTRGRTKKVVAESEPEQEDEDDNGEEEEEQAPAPKKTRKTREVPIPPAPKKTRTPKVDNTANIDLNEYYNNKNRMEFMTIEIDRLTNKVNKLKQYKSIVNKITGGEFEAPEVQPQYNQQQYQEQQVNQGGGSRKINDSIFDF